MSEPSPAQWIRSHVELLLQSEWERGRVSADADGDYPFRHGSAACWVSLVPAGRLPMVRVFAHAASGLKPSLKLLSELNDIQRRCVSAAVFLEDGVVEVSQTLSPVGLTGPVLHQALDAVATIADDIGPLLAAMFNGRTPFPSQTPETEDAT
jgi:hypothetical protein